MEKGFQLSAGHLGFRENVAFHRTTLEEKPRKIKRGVRQCIRKRLEGLRVERSGCGLGHIISFICFKLLGNSSNRGYVAL